MKRIFKLSAKAFAVIMASIWLCLPASSVFAANSYGINYTGGQPVSVQNVNVAPEIIDSLTELVNDGETIIYSDSPLWEDGYYKSGTSCSKYKYIRVWDNNRIGNDKPVVTIRSEKYDLVATINAIAVNGADGLSKNNSIVVGGFYRTSKTTFPSAGSRIYTSSTCEEEVANVRPLDLHNDEHIFIELELKLYEHGKEGVFTSDQLYFGMTDIDAAQSYKILNPDNLLSKDNMFVKNNEALNNPNPDGPKNMFDADGHYIYSEFDPATGNWYTGDQINNIFVKVKPSVQTEGLRVVFGFSAPAGSAVQYYAKQFHVDYESDEYGEVTGITTENVISGNNPSGSETTPIEEYDLLYWIADKDVVLTDGTEIAAGEPIPNAKVLLVVVNEDLVFTAIHDTEPNIPAVPDTGRMTESSNAIVVILPLAAILSVAAFIKLLPVLTHKKIKFDQE